MIVNPSRQFAVLRLALMRLTHLCLAFLTGCAYWPSVEAPLRDATRGETIALDAPDPDPPADVVPIVDDTSTELGARAPFPRPDRPRTSIPATVDRHPSITSVTAAQPSWVEVGRTHEGRAIEAIWFGGEASERVLIVSSMAGNDSESVRFVDRLATRISRVDDSSLAVGTTATLLIRSPNPDGLAGHYSTNSRGVELNRNFPSPRFPVGRTTRTGPEPGSEPETQAIMQMLEEFQPTRVVHIRPGSGNTLLLLCDSELLRPMTERAQGLDFNVACHDGDFKAGSIEEYCRSEWGSEVVTVYLPGLQSMADSDDLLRGTAQTCLSIDLPAIAENDEGLSAQPASTHEVLPSGEHGFVESLPPPEEHADTPQDSRYYELPPPPGL